MPINLLPPDLTPKEGILKLSNALKKVSILGYAALSITILLLVGAFFILSRQIDESASTQKRLKDTVTSLKQTEQRLILVKDRLEKAGRVLGFKTGSDEIEGFEQLVLMFPEGVAISEVDLNTNSIKVNLLAQSSSSLAEFLARLLASGLYNRIVLTDLGFNQKAGYELVLNLIS